MKSIGITSYNRDLLKEYSDENVSYDGLVHRLIMEVDEYMPMVTVDEGKYTAIKLHDDTLMKLKSYALTRGESYENILVRMLLISKSLNNVTD